MAGQASQQSSMTGSNGPGMWRRSRWYDATPSLRLAMDLLYLLPSSERHQVIQNVLQQHEWPDLTTTAPGDSPVNLPAKAIRRWYDQDPLLRQALEQWAQWPAALQQALGKQLLQQIKALPKQ